MKRFQNDVGVLVPNVMLPARDADFSKWAVVACDQFTSQPEYWEKADALIGADLVQRAYNRRSLTLTLWSFCAPVEHCWNYCSQIRNLLSRASVTSNKSFASDLPSLLLEIWPTFSAERALSLSNL